MPWLAVGRSRKCQGRGRVGRGWIQLRKVCRSDSRLACRRWLGPPLFVSARSTPCAPIVIAHMFACISVSVVLHHPAACSTATNFYYDRLRWMNNNAVSFKNILRGAEILFINPNFSLSCKVTLESLLFYFKGKMKESKNCLQCLVIMPVFHYQVLCFRLWWVMR